MSKRPKRSASRLDLLRFLSRRFMLVMPLFVAAVGLSFYWTVRSQYLADAGRRAVDLAQQMNGELTHEIVTGEGLVLPARSWTRGTRGLRVHKLIRRNLSLSDVRAITLYSAEGRVVYSTIADGRKDAPDPELLAAALAGEPRWRVEKATDEPRRGGGTRHVRPLAAYIPVYLSPGYPDSSETIGAFEIHLSLDVTRANLRAFGWTIGAGSLGILLALFAILTMVAKQASTLVQLERASQQRLESELARNVEELEERVIQRTADLSSERELLATVLNEAPSAFVLLDERANVLFKSRQFDKLMDSRGANGAGKKENSGGVGSSVCSHCGHPESSCAARAAIRYGRPQTVVHASAHRGGMRWLEHRAVPVSLEDSTVRVVEMITDVTAQEESQQRLARASTLALTGELAATVIHEVRNAATSTKLLLQLWAEREPPNSRHGKSVAVAMASVARMEVLAENLLRIGRRTEREWTECDMVQLVRGAVELIRPETYRRRIALVVDTPADALCCRADSGMLTAALLNVLLNATQAMTDLPDGRRRQLTISVGSDVLAEDFEDVRDYPYGPDFADHAGDLSTQLGQGSRVVFVEIQDTGPGISTENRERVFEPFFTTKASGTGLGLPITSRIVKQHGGTLLISSEPGSGTCVRVVLPASSEGCES